MCNPYDLKVHDIVDVWRMSSPYVVRMRVTSLPPTWERGADANLLGEVIRVACDPELASIAGEPVPGEVECVPVEDLDELRLAYGEVDA